MKTEVFVCLTAIAGHFASPSFIPRFS